MSDDHFLRHPNLQIFLSEGLVTRWVYAVGESCENELFHGNMFCGNLPPCAPIELPDLLTGICFLKRPMARVNCYPDLSKDQAVTDHASLT